MSRPSLELASVVEALARHHVRWVLAGSVVLLAYGARFEPGDIDVVPALDGPNLDAIPSHHPDRPECPAPEWHRTWRPAPACVDNLDHLYVTRLWMVDIVPRLCGTHDELLAEARPVRVAGHEVVSADPRTVLERAHGHRRKDVARGSEIDAVRSRVDGGLALRPDLDRRF